MIKNNIKKLRRSQELSQRVLAEILGVRQTLISAWELGKAVPPEESVNDLADYFGVSPAYILGKSQTPYGQQCAGEGQGHLDTACIFHFRKEECLSEHSKPANTAHR